MNNILKKFILIWSCFLLVFSQKTNVTLTHADEVTEFYNEFNDLSDKDISYSKGNNTTFVSHNYTYYSSSFSFNNTHKRLQFGRNTSATNNISDFDELRMEFDLNGYVEYLKLDIGAVNTNNTGNIEFKVQYSTDFGKTYSDFIGSEQTVLGNEEYSLYINDSYESIRFKFMITNVDQRPGKNMIITSMKITGSNLYAYSIGHLIQMIDNCTCDNIRLNYENIMNEYNGLSDYEKSVFDSILTEDAQTTYKERLDYLLQFCAKSESDNNSVLSSLFSSNTNVNPNEEYKTFIVVILIALFAFMVATILYKAKTKNRR